MKKDRKLLVVAILLLLVSVSFTSYAIYRTAVTGTGSVTAAAWNISFAEGQNELTDNFTLTFGASDCTGNNHVANGVIAPGATCEKTVTLTATGTQVDVTYAVTADNANITATKNNTSVPTTGANTFSASVTDNGNGTIAHNAASQTTTLTVTLEWDDEDDSNAAQNPNTINDADTTLAGATISVPLTLVAKQDIS